MTGIETPGGLERITDVIKRVLADDAPYRMTQRLFVYRDDWFEDLK